MKSKEFVLHNGVIVPHPGFGTCKIPEEEVCGAVLRALEAGYRHFDTASFYGSESGLGEALRKSGLAREEVFIASKVWNTERGYERTRAAFAASLERMGLDYLDLYLIHWPANKKQFGDGAEALNAETWRALEDLYEEGIVRAIGVSNFLPHHLEGLLKTARICPMVNQVECHPGWLQFPVLEYCREHGIVVEAWSPLGRRAALDHPVIRDVAQRTGLTTAQVCLAWLRGHGVLPLPKAADPSRMEENLREEGMLDEKDMRAIDALAPMWLCSDPDMVDF
ncbi:aldo/keto reductase [Mailhella massiliensis]|uniref:Aldo/keto reductase n=1 Tax=Mailhella massiliensis TaxID=1903261 RepID=A0A921AVQ6_9BACT|nr:aldo/keto reductase [Mailhella massiliensis]HJD96826.1 aldo/keto reductase [Mailhella massiliensis]